MLNQRGGSRTDTLIKLVLIFFISLLSFSVGTFVGKQFSDSKHRLASLESEYEEGAQRSTASIPSDATEVKPENALTEKDIQQIADEFTQSGEGAESGHHAAANEHGDTHTAHNEEMPEHQAEAKGKVAPSEHHTATTETHNSGHGGNMKKTAEHSPAERVAMGHAPAENKPEPKSRIPANLPTSVAASSIGKYTVQISSHQNEEEAVQEANRLREKGFLSAFVVPATVKGKQWYRVSVGLFDNMAEAKKHREKLIHEGHISSAFIQKIVQ